MFHFRTLIFCRSHSEAFDSRSFLIPSEYRRISCNIMLSAISHLQYAASTDTNKQSDQFQDNKHFLSSSTQ
jgi:hypothetical protein